MANHKSAIKRHRQSLRRRDRNRETRLAVKNVIKKARAAIQAGKVAEAQGLVRDAEKTLSSAATKGVFHKKNASRRIGRLASALAKAGKAKAA